MSDLAALVVGLSALGRSAPEGARLVAVGWATVDLERTLDGLPELDFGPEVDEPALGARARVAWANGVGIVCLEPSTEGRLAAALARRGEGIACLYLEAPIDPVAGGVPTALGRSGRLLPHPRPWGPHLVLLGLPEAPDVT